MTPEAKLSKEFGKELKKHDCFGFRIETSHLQPGIPDWCILLPGRAVFVELKAGSSLTKAQVIVHQYFKKLNIPIFILTRTKNSVIIDNIEFKTFEEAVGFIVKEQ
jgi:hypothetical protein